MSAAKVEPDPSGPAIPVCNACKEKTRWSTQVCGVFLWFPGEDWPVQLRVGREPECRLCFSCEDAAPLLELFDRAQRGLPEADRRPTPWQLARVVFQDGFSVIARNPRLEVAAA